MHEWGFGELIGMEFKVINGFMYASDVDKMPTPLGMSGSDLGKKRQMMYQMDLALNEQLPRYLPQWLVWYAMQGLTWWIPQGKTHATLPPPARSHASCVALLQDAC